MNLYKIRNRLTSFVVLKFRNSVYFSRPFYGVLVKNNILSELREFRYEIIEDLPTIIHKEERYFVSFRYIEMERFQYGNIPPTHNGTVLAYILRYKYPHSLPGLSINTGLIPRRYFPALVHRQHLNTLDELPPKERDEFKEALKINSGDQILEAGPFFGFGSLRLSQLVGEDGHILSIEADHEAFNILKLNLNYNKVTNVTPLNFAISDRNDDNVVLKKDKYQANTLLDDLIHSTAVQTVKSQTIQTIASSQKFYPNFLILTINGMEYRSLLASRDFLWDASPIRIITPGWYYDHQGRLGNRIIETLKDLKFRVTHTPGMHIFAYK